LRGCIYVERVPNVWVQVMDAALFKTLTDYERKYMIDKAVKHGHERTFPS
jgi:hypothetical protein